MREAAFIKQNREKWQRLEQLIGKDPRGLSPDEASDLYVALNDDLSYARTFYPNGQVTSYLNQLASEIHRHIYRNQRSGADKFWKFWKTQLPLLMASTRRELLISAIVFGLAVLIGALSARHDSTFARLILGDHYVEMTLSNIAEGNPMGVYGGTAQGDMFIQITLNNILVAFRAFALGLLFSYGTWMALMYNGIMLGAFQYFMYEQGVLNESLRAIWLHGTLEIASIVIAGAAGIVMGNAILFPGTHTRLESFKRGARKGMKIVAGLVPCFIIAGFIESYLTRYSQTMPLAAVLIIIGGSLAAVILYFILYPYYVQRKQNHLGPSPKA